MLIGDLDARAKGKMKTEEIHKKQKGIMAVIKKKKKEKTQKGFMDNNDSTITKKKTVL